MWQPVEIWNVFNTFQKNVFKKTGVPFLAESTKHASFPYKTAISEANVKTNKDKE